MLNTTPRTAQVKQNLRNSGCADYGGYSGFNDCSDCADYGGYSDFNDCTDFDDYGGRAGRGGPPGDGVRLGD
jgi:hypothetical protein